ncbi:MAG: (2Fe-2S) ferredoxin domain-containing protein [Candidatus Firestonebacteria bacterium]
MKKLTREDIEKIEPAKKDLGKSWIKVGMSTCGVAAGANEVYTTLLEESKKRNIEIDIRKCGCQGACSAEPLVEVSVEGLPKVLYGRVTKDVAVTILERHVRNKKLLNDYIFEIN